MSDFNVELVGKIGSMALIRPHERDMDYNIFARIGRALQPGMIWVSSGATEIGRLDYLKRGNGELAGQTEEIKADYAAQGQAVLMETYRRYVPPHYSLRQVLVEHTHFNNPEKCEFIKHLLLRAAGQRAIPIINYNDAVSFRENRLMELTTLRGHGEDVVECIDNDETAATIASLVRAKILLILTSVEGIYRDPADKSTRVKRVTGSTVAELLQGVEELQSCCRGSSREGANGAWAKLEFIKKPLAEGTKVFIANAKYPIEDILSGEAPSTMLCIS
ncbi:MAG: uridylate kinase [Clostridia bacterium]|nr:uridylate kinase [Clostridia bacterium]